MKNKTQTETKFKNTVSLFIALGILGTMFCGCQNSTTKNGKTSIDKVTTTDSYPIKTDAKLTYWTNLHPSVSNSYKNLNLSFFAKQLIKETGIEVEFVHPPSGQEIERFSLMVASDNLTDIVDTNLSIAYSGGAGQALNDGVVLKLNDIIKKVSPNLERYLESNPEVKKNAVTDDGSYYMYPFIRGDKRLNTFQGFMIRKDLLEKSGETELPQTIEDWNRVLYKFKDMGVKCPLNLRTTNLDVPIATAFGVQGNFYIENDTVKYGSYEKEFQNYIKLMAKWYKDGILDKEFIDNDSKRINYLVTSGNVGMIYGSSGGEFGLWIPTLKENHPEAEFVPVAYPVMNKGDKPKFGQTGNVVQGAGASITSKCSNIEAAARLLDYGYSQKGHLLYNFGIENESYTIKNGDPIYKKEITDKKLNGGISSGEAISKYARSTYSGPFVQDYNYITQYYSLPAQKAALDIWSNTDADKYQIPNITRTLDESSEYSTIMNDIETFKSEQLVKYINGQLDAENMEPFFTALKDMGIEKAIKIQQTSYERFLKR